jgi:hypothetical protein
VNGYRAIAVVICNCQKKNPVNNTNISQHFGGYTNDGIAIQWKQLGIKKEINS